MNKVISMIIGLTLSGNVMSAHITKNKIARIMMGDQYGKNLFIEAEGDVPRDASHCHSNNSWDFVLSTETEIGQQMMSIVLTAYAAQKTVTLYGTDTCTNHSNAENLWRIDVY